MDLKELTIMLPVATSNLPLANRCIEHLLKVCDLPIIIIDDYGRDEHYIKNDRIKFIHNTFPTRQPLVKIWNQCIKECPTEYVLLASWRERPLPEHFQIIKKKLNEGFGVVALQSLHFFAFSKHLMTVIGFFDEGFTQGQFEDTDFYNRLRMNDVAVYSSNEVHEEPHQSMWLNGGHINKAYFDTKWIERKPKLVQLKEEVNIEDRKLYQNVYAARVYKSFKDSELSDPNLHGYYFNTFTEIIKQC